MTKLQTQQKNTRATDLEMIQFKKKIYRKQKK